MPRPAYVGQALHLTATTLFMVKSGPEGAPPVPRAQATSYNLYDDDDDDNDDEL